MAHILLQFYVAFVLRIYSLVLFVSCHLTVFRCRLLYECYAILVCFNSFIICFFCVFYNAAQ